MHSYTLKKNIFFNVFVSTISWIVQRPQDEKEQGLCTIFVHTVIFVNCTNINLHQKHKLIDEIKHIPHTNQFWQASSSFWLIVFVIC